MKNIIRTVTLLSVISAMAISMTACTPKSAPMEVVETTVMTEQVTTPEETTIPEETTAPETTAPMEESVEKVYSNGIYCERYYDANGEVRKMDIYKEDGVSIDRVYERASGDNWYFTKYNENGNVVSQDLAKFIGENSRYIFKRQYNESGKLIDETQYSENGELIKVTMSKDDGLTYTTILFDYYENGAIKTGKVIANDKSYIVESYSEHGGMTSKYNYDTEGVLTHYFEYDNNENGKVIRMTKYSPDGVMMEYSLFKYDKNGNQTEVKTYTPDGKLV